MLAAVLGEAECLKIMLTNPSLVLEATDPIAGTNAFWLAAFFGRGECVRILANAGIDIFNCHKESKSNALHVAIERKHYEVANLLIGSKFPLNNKTDGGLTALVLVARDKDAYYVGEQLVKRGAEVNLVTDYGMSALAQTVLSDNKKLAGYLLKSEAKMFNEDIEWRDNSAFFVAINQ